MKFLCWLGFHNYKPTETEDLNQCARCPQQQQIIHAIWHDDMSKMVGEGKLPLNGYLKAVKRGYVQKSDFEEKDDFGI